MVHIEHSFRTNNTTRRIDTTNKHIRAGQLCFEVARIDAKAECALRAGDNGVAP